MPRKLKTFITNLGFFELAVAAPSMKAALEAWGMSHNAFQQGFAKQTNDPAIIAATIAKPGVVLKRAVGSSGEFGETAELPKSLPNIKPTAISKAKARPAKAPKAPKRAKKPEQDRAAIISFEKEKRKREEQREKEEAKLAKEREERVRATDKAELALEDAREEHENLMEEIQREREMLDRREEKEVKRWEAQREKLEAAIDRARR
jgi:colicin import membrane protein